MKKMIFALMALICIFAAALYFYFAAEKSKSQVDAMKALTEVSERNSPRKEIWIGSDSCKTTFGANTIAFCDGVSKDNSLWLDSGADAAVKSCFEYTAGKLKRPVSEARDIACEVKAAYQDRLYEYSEELDAPGIENSNYSILNDWVNK